YRLHKDLVETLPVASGVRVEYHPVPQLRVTFDPDEAAALEDGVGWRREHSPGVRWLDAGEVREIEPRLSEETLGGLLLPDTLEVDAYVYMLALLQAGERAGVTLRHGEVTGLISQGGRATGVRLSNGR